MAIALAAVSLVSVGWRSAAIGQTFTPVVKNGAAVPTQPTTFTSVNLASVDNVGAAFIGSFSISSSNYSGLYNAKGGVITTLADRSTLGPSGETINSIIAAGDYENGVIVFAANTTIGRTLYRYTPTAGLTALVHQGDTLPGSTSPINTMYNRGVGGDANEYALGSVLADTSTAVYQTSGGFPVRTVDDKTRSPIAETGNFIAFPEISYRNGHTAFIGTGKDPDDASAAAEPSGVFISTPGSPVEIVAGRNQIVPGTPDDRFNEFERPRIMPDGRVAFTGGFEEDDPELPPEHHLGVFIRNPDLTWKVYADTDMELPGLHDSIQEFQNYSLESGVNYFGVNDESGGQYIYYESADGVFTHLIDNREMLGGKQLSSVRILNDTALAGGELFFRASFADGSTGVYTVTVPEPSSAVALGGAALFAAARRRRR